MHNDVHVPGRQQELAPTKNIEIPEHLIRLGFKRQKPNDLLFANARSAEPLWSANYGG